MTDAAPRCQDPVHESMEWGRSKARRVAWFPTAMLCAWLMMIAGSGTAWCTPEDGESAPAKPAKRAAKGKKFRSTSEGIEAVTPASWRLTVDKAADKSWKRLATFYDPKVKGGPEATLSVRPRRAQNLEALGPMIRADWAKSSKAKISSLVTIPPSANVPIPHVVVEAAYVVQGAAKDGVKPPPISYQINATYYLTNKREFLLYGICRSTLWSRVRPLLEALRKSVKLTQKKRSGPTGEGAYRDDIRGFSCRYPKDYAVVMPRFKNHFVDFEGKTSAQPTLGIYRIPFNGTAEQDADRLEAFYVKEQSGQAKVVTGEVAGSTGYLLEAKANLGGEDKFIMMAITKRGKHCYRLKATMPVASEAAGRSMFRAFLDSFSFRPVPKK